MSKNNKLILIPSIALILLIIAISYAFFTSRSNITEQTIGADAARITLEYTDCGNSNQSDCSDINSALKPGDSITKTFKVENTGTVPAEFAIVFSELQNTFLHDELVYKLEDTTNGDLVVEETPVIYSEELLTDELILDDININPDEIKEYKLTITFKEIDGNQNYNADATFNIKLGIGMVTSQEPIFAGLMRQPSQNGIRLSNNVLGKSINPNSFESITTLDSNEVSNNAIDSWNVSGDGTDLVIAWYTDTDNNGLYELYIGQDGGVVANPDSSNLFSGFTNVETIDLSNFDTSNTVNMDSMYAGNINLNNIIVHDDLVTTNVTNTDNMFDGCTSLVNNNTIEAGIPDIYQQVEYIQNNGTQYIDTNFQHNQNTRFVGEVELTNVSIWNYPFGSFGRALSGETKNKLFTLEINADSALATYYGQTAKSFGISAYGRHSFDLNKNVHRIDNKIITYPTVTFQTIYDDMIFGSTGYTGSTGAISTRMKLFYFKIYDDDNLVRDFVPVYRKSDNVAGLYDLVSGEFFTNQRENGDNFIVGPNVNTNYYVKHNQGPFYTMIYDHGSIGNNFNFTYKQITESTVSRQQPFGSYQLTNNSTYMYFWGENTSTYRKQGGAFLNTIDISNYSAIYLKNKITTSGQNTYGSIAIFPDGITELVTDGVAFNHFYIYNSSYTIPNFVSQFSISGNRDIAIHIASCGYPYSIGLKFYAYYLFKPDNWRILANKAGASVRNINDLFEYSNTILNNQKLVNYMVAECTGDFMITALTNQEFMTALENSPYRNTIMNNTTWKHFYDLVKEIN